MTRLPEQCQTDDPAAQSLINTTPLILGCLRGETPDLIDARIQLNTGSSLVEAQESPMSLVPLR